VVDADIAISGVVIVGDASNLEIIEPSVPVIGTIRYEIRGGEKILQDRSARRAYLGVGNQIIFKLLGIATIVFKVNRRIKIGI